jgi:hypothetical protein
MTIIDKALLIDEGRVYGARYFTVQPEFVADVPTWFKTEWDEMVEWCETTYGPRPEGGVFVPGGRWYINNSRFWFREQKDMEWFILRWA